MDDVLQNPESLMFCLLNSLVQPVYRLRELELGCLLKVIKCLIKIVRLLLLFHNKVPLKGMEGGEQNVQKGQVFRWLRLMETEGCDLGGKI